MLLLIRLALSGTIRFSNSNTSHVTINPNLNFNIMPGDADSNTSHVTINPP